MTQEQILNVKLECLKIALAMNPHADLKQLIIDYNVIIKELGF